VKGIAHITGGAFYSKATKILSKGLGMVINKKSWDVPSIFKIMQEKGGITEKEMYTVFNMGIGMIVVVDKKNTDKIVNNLNKSYKTHIIGEVVKSNKKMCLV
ncbi:MAG: phosphoribosylformylglycinamidine cyclo-ligase, partial [Candidatus Omnitrophica bacterium]|nr:phosphoribosylformylglycinamidine cyclo-ligase [Candidatus Omnitrophota bacterium]